VRRLNTCLQSVGGHLDGARPRNPAGQLVRDAGGKSPPQTPSTRRSATLACRLGLAGSRPPRRANSSSDPSDDVRKFSVHGIDLRRRRPETSGTTGGRLDSAARAPIRAQSAEWPLPYQTTLARLPRIRSASASTETARVGLAGFFAHFLPVPQPRLRKLHPLRWRRGNARTVERAAATGRDRADRHLPWRGVLKCFGR
jgi:hypothetical protein